MGAGVGEHKLIFLKHMFFPAAATTSLKDAASLHQHGDPSPQKGGEAGGQVCQEVPSLDQTEVEQRPDSS